jgi:hypothetical protein
MLLVTGPDGNTSTRYSPAARLGMLIDVLVVVDADRNTDVLVP